MLPVTNTSKGYSSMCVPVKISQAAKDQDCAENGDTLAFAAQQILVVHSACP